MDENTFVDRWASSLERGAGAVFIGAGLSCAAGFPTWRKLLVEIARELKLDIEQEHDLAGVAQYSLNRQTGKRHKLSALIAREFPPKDPPEPFRILARLPLRHVWTTNYDGLAEAAWEEERKALDVKSRNNDLGIDKPWAHAVLYKMHGSVDHPAEVVIAKDDYELYRRTRSAFLQVLTGHLISKQILFLGFSFTDPNIAHLFARIRETFRDQGPEHYAIVRRPQRGTGAKAKKRFELDTVRHNLWVEDLKRYGIQSVEIDEYDELTEVLSSVEHYLARRSVLVSGSFPDSYAAADLPTRCFIEDVARGVGQLVAMNQKRLVTGFGLVVGSAAIAGALNVVLAERTPNLEKSLLIRPFPQTPVAGVPEKTFGRRYRDSMIQQAGICIFIGGLKDETRSGKTRRMTASGVLDEFDSAKRLGRVLVPIGATGGAAAELWKLVAADRMNLCPGASKTDFQALMDATSASKLVNTVGKILRAVDKPHRGRTRRQ